MALFPSQNVRASTPIEAMAAAVEIRRAVLEIIWNDGRRGQPAPPPFDKPPSPW
ncbi:MAG TPA: hypothetical protein P5256_19975 [Beijerinckiaceae bacterium]|nr:hypothetical protein [Methylobacteriaceae bacterium]HRY05419.1 hypothetical protein [Beijerinckiaceae bacterium]